MGAPFSQVMSRTTTLSAVPMRQREGKSHTATQETAYLIGRPQHWPWRCPGQPLPEDSSLPFPAWPQSSGTLLGAPHGQPLGAWKRVASTIDHRRLSTIAITAPGVCQGQESDCRVDA